MIERVRFEVEQGGAEAAGAVVRYGMMERASRSAKRLGVTLLAFGIGRHEVRLVVEGEREEITNLLRALKVGTVRALRGLGADLRLSPAERWTVAGGDLGESVAWAHRAPMLPEEGRTAPTDPLASPWTSHRDLMGYRRAPFYDPAVLKGRVDPQRVHALCGGRDLPVVRARREVSCEPLSLLLRIAAALVGVLPADRRCFRLFVHFARARGWATEELAEALRLTARRVRQLAEGVEPLLGLAVTSLGDPRLCLVP